MQIKLIIFLCLLIISLSYIQNSHAITLCGVTIIYGIETVTTNKSPCINVNSISVNSTGITTNSVATEFLRQYNFIAPNSNLPITAKWSNQNVNESDWYINSIPNDGQINVSTPQINLIDLNYVNVTYTNNYFSNNNHIPISQNNSFLQLFLSSASPSNPNQSTVPATKYNTMALNLGFMSVPRNGSSYDVFIENTTTHVINSWYNGLSGSSTLTKKIGNGLSSLTLSCALNSISPKIVSNSSNIYYECGNSVNHINAVTGINTHDYTSTDSNSVNARLLFLGMHHVFSASSNPSGFNYQLNSEAGNVTQGGSSGSWASSNQQISLGTTISGIKYNQNTTLIQTLPSSNMCNIIFKSTNASKSVDNIACDSSLPPMAIKYWNGMLIQKVANYGTNTTQQFLSSIDSNAYKQELSLPCLLLVNEQPCTTFILNYPSSTNYLVVLTSTHVYFVNADSVKSYFTSNKYALQSYDVITTTTTSNYEIPNPILQPMTLYGININATSQETGLFTLPSGYSVRTTTLSPSVRSIDPRWTNDNTDIPIIATNSGLFPIFLTVVNAPQLSAVKITQGSQIINSQESVWSIAQTDGTKTVEFDLPAQTCANVYVADISQFPSIWNFEGLICATGINQKSISYANTLPFTFYTLKYGVTDTYNPANGLLTVATRSSSTPFTYTILLKNSTGVISLNQTFTFANGQTLQFQNFNVSSISKPVSLYVITSGNQIYNAYLGSALSLASVSSFFHQYFSYQGFDLLSFIPVIFASMFTRNTVGVGAVLVVLVIATLSWLSVTIVPEPIVYVSIFVSVLGMIGYRAYGY